jgi:hypothetical protein
LNALTLDSLYGILNTSSRYPTLQFTNQIEETAGVLVFIDDIDTMWMNPENEDWNRLLRYYLSGTDFTRRLIMVIKVNEPLSMVHQFIPESIRSHVTEIK